MCTETSDEDYVQWLHSELYRRNDYIAFLNEAAVNLQKDNIALKREMQVLRQENLKLTALIDRQGNKKRKRAERSLSAEKDEHSIVSWNSTSRAVSRYWSTEEHNRFVQALKLFGSKAVKRISAYVGTRTPTQVRTHAQKYFLKLKKGENLTSRGDGRRAADFRSGNESLNHIVIEKAYPLSDTIAVPALTIACLKEEDSEGDDNSSSEPESNEAPHRIAMDSLLEVALGDAETKSTCSQEAKTKNNHRQFGEVKNSNGTTNKVQIEKSRQEWFHAQNSLDQ